MAAKAHATTSRGLYVFIFIGLNIVAAYEEHSLAAPEIHTATEYVHFNVSCILLDVSCSISVDLHVGSMVKSVNYDLPQNAIPSGNCTSKMSYITLDWNNGRANLSLSMAFKEEEKEWEMYNLNFTANSVNNQPLTTNGTEKVVNASLTDPKKMAIKAGSQKSFKCNQELDIALQGTVKVIVIIKRIQLQPFDDNQKGSFDDADVCAVGEKLAEPVDTIVPTVVGCVLAGLIVILIFTYFVGRCKTPAGYQHM
ncbi:lysosome-associated membrane glycoprotein 1-like isoform X1 [Acropora palmata]|uniref:lysosome-associated membrane glycoprotein 1-like isoform X1 n=1 Tax=Acropora palmata TaxID=6131 RepID=UPI003DA12474